MTPIEMIVAIIIALFLVADFYIIRQAYRAKDKNDKMRTRLLAQMKEFSSL